MNKLIGVICFLAIAAGVRADVTLPAFFSDHMVLQREMPVRIWGKATAGEKVIVKFRTQEKTAVAGTDGKWMVTLEPLKAGGPDKLVVTGNNTVTLDDVLVGEVWVGSGQSNMAGGVNNYDKGDSVLAAKAAAAPYPRLRLLANCAAHWTEAGVEQVRGFSALMFCYGLRLQQELDVPVGVIVSAMGGTSSGRWISEAALNADAGCVAQMQQYVPMYPEEEKKFREIYANWEKSAADAKAQGKPVPAEPEPPAKPFGCYNGKIGDLYEMYVRPLQPYTMRGVLWDQGEGGTCLPMVDQYTLMGALIRSWRKDWGQGEFPFIYIQKPSGDGPAWDYTNPVTKNAQPFSPLPDDIPTDTSEIEEYLKMMRHPNTGMAMSIDLGAGVHPVNKSGYAHRASDVALGMVYGRKIEYYGPIYDSHVIEGNKIRIRFTHIGPGLAFRHGNKLQGFAVAGADKIFYWADCSIDGETVILSCDKVSQPVAVRYGWARQPNHTWANLFSKNGLPALSFRTDNW